MTQFSVLPRIAAASAGVKHLSSSSAAVGADARRSTAEVSSVSRRMRGVSVGGSRSFLVTGVLLVGDGRDGHGELFGVAVEGPVACSLLALLNAGEVARVDADGFGETPQAYPPCRANGPHCVSVRSHRHNVDPTTLSRQGVAPGSLGVNPDSLGVLPGRQAKPLAMDARGAQV